MNQDKYIRTIQDLEKVGAKWWPDEVKNEAANNSMLQYLLNTQDKFISLLTLAEQKMSSNYLISLRLLIFLSIFSSSIS